MMTTPERIAEIEDELAKLRHLIETEKEMVTRNLAAELIAALLPRLAELKRKLAQQASIA